MTPRKILIIRFSSLGDIILTTPIYRNIKEKFPEDYLYVLIKENFKGILENNPYIEKVIVLKKNQSIFNLLFQLKKNKFDIVIDLHNNLRSRMITLFLNIPLTIHYKKHIWARRWFVQTKKITDSLKKHTIKKYLDTLKVLNIEPQEYPPEIFTDTNFKKNNLEPIRFLIIQTAFLGDAVLTTPMFEVIKQTYPSSSITLLCTPEIKDIFTDQSHIDQILIMDKRNTEKSFFSLLKWSNKLKGKYDIAILPHRSFRSSFLVWLAHIPQRIGFQNSQGKFFLTDLVSFDWKTHDLKRNLKLLEAIGIYNKESPIHISIQQSNSNFEKIKIEHQITDQTLLIGINSSSIWKTKRWIPEYFAKVADQLIDEFNCKIILIGSKNDTESVNSVVLAMKHSPINLCNKTDLKSLIYIISKCHLFITNDSGPMHLATAVNIPVVAIFGPTTKELGFFPYGEKSTVIETQLSCRPCSLHGGNKCPLNHFKCMNDITPEMVLDPCRKYLKTYENTTSH